ncbi:P-loop containing nucleoside triphosphate hydrolase protein, partial [Coniophora puteana RWD-64-598 SS2]
EGHKYLRNVLKGCMPYDTHDYQLEAIGHVLDGRDVLCITPTGSGKTDALIRLMHIALAFSKDENHPKTVITIPKDPAMVVVCPTKALEEDMAAKMIKAKLETRIINSDTLGEARREGRDLLKEAQTGVSMILVSPEQLKSKKFRHLLDSHHITQRILFMAVDEAHLLNSWGHHFRKDFLQIGFCRKQLPARVRVFAATATLRPGQPTENVIGLLGFSEYHVIRRSNLRSDVQLLMRTMTSGLNGRAFTELSWLVHSRRPAIVFCTTIALGFRVATWLRQQVGQDHQRRKKIRMYNSLNWSKYNKQTMKMLYKDPDGCILVATRVLAQGIDPPSIRDIVVLGEPDDCDDYLQMLGRVNRAGAFSDSRAVFYITGGATQKASAVMEGGEGERPVKRLRREGDDGGKMAVSVAKLIVAGCKVNSINAMYGNPTGEIPCQCESCMLRPVNTKVKCDCSG